MATTNRAERSAQATLARRSRARFARPGVSPSRTAFILLAGVVLMTLALHYGFGAPWLGSWLWMVNLAALAAFALDKAQAQRDGRRVPELVLHALALVGGSPAALVAMRAFRHKTRKVSFRLTTGLIVAAQLIALAVWLGLA